MINYLKQNILSLIIIILLIMTIVQINLFTNQYQVEQRKIQNYFGFALLSICDWLKKKNSATFSSNKMQN